MQFIGDDEWYYATLQALPKYQQTPHAAIAVLEWMDTFQPHVEVQYVVERYLFQRVVFCNQCLHTLVYLFRFRRCLTFHLVWQQFVFAHGKPIFLAVGGVGLQQLVQLFNVRLGDTVGGVVNNIVNAAEVVYRLDNIVDSGILGGDTESVGLKNVACLLFGQAATFNVVGVIGEVNLRTVVDAAFQPALFFLSQTRK